MDLNTTIVTLAALAFGFLAWVAYLYARLSAMSERLRIQYKPHPSDWRTDASTITR